MTNISFTGFLTSVKTFFNDMYVSINTYFSPEGDSSSDNISAETTSTETVDTTIDANPEQDYVA